MPEEKKLEFRKGIEEKNNGIKDTDVKIDVDDVDPDSDEAQEKAKNYFGNNDAADNSGESDDETDSEEDEDDDSKDKPDEDDKSKEGEESDEDESDEDKDKSGEEADAADDDKSGKGEFDGYDTFEEYKAAMAENTKKDIPSDKDETEPEVQKNIIVDVFKKHAEIISAKTIENFEKFYETGNDAFIHLDTSLYKVYKELKVISESLPMKERIEKAIKLAFGDKIIQSERKKEKALTEVRAQKVNKAASDSTKGGSGKTEKTHSPETLAIAKSWGIKL